MTFVLIFLNIFSYLCMYGNSVYAVSVDQYCLHTYLGIHNY